MNPETKEKKKSVAKDASPVKDQRAAEEEFEADSEEQSEEESEELDADEAEEEGDS